MKIKQLKNLTIRHLLDPNFQSAIRDIFESRGLYDFSEYIKRVCDYDIFSILEYSDIMYPTKIIKNETGEIFTKGDTVWSTEYNTEITNIYFDYALTGEYIGNSYYKFYVRGGDGGLYRLDKICTLENCEISRKIKELNEKLEIEYLENQKKQSESKNPELHLKPNDWVTNEHHGTVDKVLTIDREKNKISFYFGDKHGVLSFCENRMGTDVVRYSTPEEILKKLEENFNK